MPLIFIISRALIALGMGSVYRRRYIIAVIRLNCINGSRFAVTVFISIVIAMGDLKSGIYMDGLINWDNKGIY